MSRLIDAEQIKLTSESFCDADGDVLVPLSEVRKAIALTPTVDAPVIHAHWVSYNDGIFKKYCCSNCNEDLPTVQVEPATVDNLGGIYESIEPTDYCPDCGAKMDEEGDK